MLLPRLCLQCYTYRFYLNWAQVGYQQYSRTTVCHFHSVCYPYTLTHSTAMSCKCTCCPVGTHR